MRLLRLFCTLVLFLASVSALAAEKRHAPEPPRVSPYAPIRIVLDGSGNNGGCVAEGNLLQAELQSLHYPPGWTLAIMCTPARWDAILKSADVRNTHAAFTRISERLTVFNIAIFRDIPLTYRHVMAHELAHISCNCSDEERAEQLAFELERGPQAASK